MFFRETAISWSLFFSFLCLFVSFRLIFYGFVPPNSLGRFFFCENIRDCTGEGSDDIKKFHFMVNTN